MDERRQRIELLFHRFGKGVGGFLLARLGDPELAEELTSRVFLKVVRSIDQLRGPPAPWLWAIVRTELARWFRDRRHLEPLSPDLADPRANPTEEFERGLDQERLRLALATLPEATQQFLYLKFFVQMTNREIAAATGLSESNVGVRVFRALRELRGLLDTPTFPAPQPEE